jgi:hypothetical protein
MELRDMLRLGILILILGLAGAEESQGQTASATSSASSIFASQFATDLAPADTVPVSSTYYFPHLAFGGGFQTTLTYVNYSPQNVSCQTAFLSDSGDPLPVPFGGAAASTRTDNLGPGENIHVQTTADLAATVQAGWAQAQCTGPVKASLLYRFYSQGVPQGEAGVNAAATPATEFVTFAETRTGVAYANPSPVPATVTITALSAAPGPALGSTTIQLAPNAHGAANIGPLLNLSNFTGSVQITATAPIVSLSLNAEAFPVFSSLPPGDLPDATPLAPGTGSGTPVQGPFPNTYYFPHLAFGGGFQTTLTYVNYSAQAVSCQTTFLSDTGASLPVPFGGAAMASRNDDLGPGGSVHVQTSAGGADPLQSGWAQAQCSGPIKASLLYRFYNQGVAQGEAAVNAATAPDTEFVTFAETRTGVAYANPSPVPALVTLTALDAGTGLALGSTTFMLAPNAHGAANIGPLLNLSSFTGSVQIAATAPIVSLSLNAEDFPVFSSLPQGDLPASTPLATGH